MLFRNSAERYATATVALHWLMLALLAAVYAMIELRELFPKDSDPRNTLKALHFMLGLSVLALVGLRLGLRSASGPAPAIVPTPGPWERRLAAVMHAALYALLIAMPLLGWLLLSAKGKPIPFFGLELPPLIAPRDSAVEWLEEVHEIGGTIGYWLIGLHAAAALFHHYVRHDNTLARMLPRRGGAPQPSR